MQVFDDLNHTDQDFTEQLLQKGEYDSCVFISCNFYQLDLTGFTFIDCEFDTCNFSNVKVLETGFQNCIIKNSKVLGVHFEACNPFLFALSFIDSKLDYSSFYKLNLTDCTFNNSSLMEVDFGETNLKAVAFNLCNLSGAKFQQTNLIKADFRTAVNYAINPEHNRIKQAKFSKSGLIGLLQDYDIIIE